MLKTNTTPIHRAGEALSRANTLSKDCCMALVRATEVCSQENAARCAAFSIAVKLPRGSRQKSRLLPRILRSQHSHIPVQHLLPAAPRLLSEKSASATFFQF